MTFYITGDKHGKLKPVKRFAKNEELNSDDTIIILGDTGFNYFGASATGGPSISLQG